VTTRNYTTSGDMISVGRNLDQAICSRRLLGQAPRVVAALHHLDDVRRRLVEIRCAPDLAPEPGGLPTGRRRYQSGDDLVAPPDRDMLASGDAVEQLGRTGLRLAHVTSMPDTTTSPRPSWRPETKWPRPNSDVILDDLAVKDHRAQRTFEVWSTARPSLRRRRCPSPVRPPAGRRRCSAGRCRRPCACRCGAGSRPAF